ncbi:hypothetical protein SAMN05192529_10412 [Arachidicoccus rhizosphaerae]|uniref:Uncharacterized protein n=1 Tax=Arachidicoccus rhizosphaerae TaxID=551991 RepID=A0A1H3WVS9_9BACT|nr:hypothetical protein [Arachidicoccus rhizosphaerae]SDZ90861.1 hypothetical protein SAMN05192529_10412 [Arachidicoccus rhizosphaerae]
MKQQGLILFILCICLLGLFALPGQLMACTGMQGHSCCHNDAKPASNGRTALQKTKSATTIHQGCQMAQEAEKGSLPCDHSAGDACGHNCHCTGNGITSVFLPAMSTILQMDQAEKVVPSFFIPIRLPKGFDFIWRPPKIEFSVLPLSLTGSMAELKILF